MTSDVAGSEHSAFSGVGVLVVEDEAIISFLIEDLLRELGCREVWHAGSVAAALKRLETDQPDLALLDVNLGGDLVFPVAERLELASVPFVFATGYGQKGLPPKWTARPVVQKPFDLDVLADALRAALRGAGATARSTARGRV